MNKEQKQKVIEIVKTLRKLHPEDHIKVIENEARIVRFYKDKGV